MIENILTIASFFIGFAVIELIILGICLIVCLLIFGEDRVYKIINAIIVSLMEDEFYD